MTRSRFASLLMIIVATLVGGACSIDINFGNDSIDGSGDIETRSFDVGDFDEIQIHNALEADITVSPGEEISVEVTADDNFFDHIEIDVSGSKLTAQTESNANLRGERLVTVVVPSLTSVEISGATSATIDAGGTGIDNLEASGASTLGVLNLNGGTIDLTVSGASNITIAGGTVSSVKADVSGASSADLRQIAVGDADVDVSGASNASFGDASSVSGDASGASNVRVEGDTTVDVDTSGASSVDRG